MGNARLTHERIAKILKFPTIQQIDEDCRRIPNRCPDFRNESFMLWNWTSSWILWPGWKLLCSETSPCDVGCAAAEIRAPECSHRTSKYGWMSLGSNCVADSVALQLGDS